MPATRFAAPMFEFAEPMIWNDARRRRGRSPVRQEGQEFSWPSSRSG
jgi:hypothetical protein